MTPKKSPKKSRTPSTPKARAGTPLLGLHNLAPDPRSRRAKRRWGRGESSGRGKTSGRGNKGQRARAGGRGKRSFEGGQNPLHRRLPKFGFTSLDFDRSEIAVLNLRDLNRFPERAEVSLETLREKGLVSKRARNLRILAQGELQHSLTIKAHHASKGALEKISLAKGVFEKIASKG